LFSNYPQSWSWSFATLMASPNFFADVMSFQGEQCRLRSQDHLAFPRLSILFLPCPSLMFSESNLWLCQKWNGDRTQPYLTPEYFLRIHSKHHILSPHTYCHDVNTFHDVNDFIRDSILDCNVSQRLSVNVIKSFAEVDKVFKTGFRHAKHLSILQFVSAWRSVHSRNVQSGILLD